MTMEEQVQTYKEDLELLPDKDMKIKYIVDYTREAKKLDAKYHIVWI
ncbi:MAG: hypothetical protein Q7S59_02810 [Sulfurimonas sp.]|nr:hypothetical protein [Sulfurimonas sp.]